MSTARSGVITLSLAVLAVAAVAFVAQQGGAQQAPPPLTDEERAELQAMRVKVDDQANELERTREYVQKQKARIAQLEQALEDERGPPPTFEGIQSLGANRYQIAKRVVVSLSEPLEARRQGRAGLHHAPDGAADGYRLFSIRRYSAADRLGLKNGDIIHSVNDIPLNTMANAVKAHQTLIQADTGERIAVEITRRGKRQSLLYDVIP